MPVLIFVSSNLYETLKLNVSFEKPVFSGPPNNSTSRSVAPSSFVSIQLLKITLVASKSLSCGFGMVLFYSLIKHQP